jgi:replicative DNA helicase
MTAENQSKCNPPLPEDELRRLVEHVVTQEDRRGFSASDPSAPPDSGDFGNSGEGDGSGWDPPTPFHEFTLPPFPTAALPDWLRDYVEASAIETQTPPDLAALVTLSVVAATCAKVIEVSVRPGWVEPVNLFTVVAMDPGNRKSAVFSAATAPLEAAERLENQMRAPEILAAQSHLEAAKERLHEAQTALKKAPVDEQASRQQELEYAAADLAGIKVPPRCRRLVDDITAEKLTSLLAEQDGRLVLMSAEGDIFDTLAGRYTAGGGVNLGVFLKAHSGDSIHVDRIGRPPEYVERPALTVCLTVQPEIVRGLHRRPEFKGRGLLARLFYALPESLLGRREIRPPSMPAQIRTQYQRAIEKLAALPIRQDSAGRVQAHELSLSHEAQRTLEEFERWLEPQLAPTGELASMTDWAGKLAGGIVRLAGLLHMAAHWRDAAPAPWDQPIAEATVTHAIQIGRYLIAHAQAAYALMGADPEVEQAKILLAWVTAKQRTRFKVRELYQGTKGRFKKVAELAPGLRILVEHGFIREAAPTFHPKPGRKPSPTYVVNPLAYSQNSHNPQNPSPRHEAGGGRTLHAGPPPSGWPGEARE